MFLVYLTMLLGPVATLANSATTFQNNLAGLDRVLDLLAEPLETYKAEITSVYKLTDQENLYRIRIIDNDDRRHFSFRPGQFIMLELPGIGHAPALMSEDQIAAVREFLLR